ncbi:MAG TPA: hypothetical protein VK914_11170 [bacterium]|jgi:hypothetical protein|nr:hypothetical protein [bacterium]
MSFDSGLYIAFTLTVAALSAALFYQAGREFAPWAAQRVYLGAFALGGAALTAVMNVGLSTPDLALALGTSLAVLRVRDAGLVCPVGLLRGSEGPDSSLCPAPVALGLAAFLFGAGLPLNGWVQVALLPGYGILLFEARWKRRAWPAWPSLGRIVLPPLLSALAGMALCYFLLMPLGLGRPMFNVAEGAGLNHGSDGVFAGLWRLVLDLGRDWTWPGLAALGLGWALLFRKKPWMAAGLFSLVLALALFSPASQAPIYRLILIQVFLGLGLAGFMAVPPLRRWLGPVFLAAALAAAWRLSLNGSSF